MDGFRPARSGQTIIWHGAPGTGKTNALRTLAYEWREWCAVHVVTDPDQFFGPDVSYLMEALTSRPRRSSKPGHTLIVLEDSGELLTGDARRWVGQGLSRFLNVCDGLLGQTLNVTLLVTTNKPMMRIHPAVRRPGRCAAEIEFRAFQPAEARRWLAGRADAEVNAPMTLAQLFALASGDTSPLPARRLAPAIGFGQSLIDDDNTSGASRAR